MVFELDFGELLLVVLKEKEVVGLVRNQRWKWLLEEDDPRGRFLVRNQPWKYLAA